jgi:hypothetical protein
MLIAIAIIVVMLLIFGAVFAHKTLQNKEANATKRKNSLRKLKMKLLEFDDIVSTLKIYHGHRPILRTITNYQIYEYENILRKFPEDEDSKLIISELKAFEATIDEVFNEKFKPELPKNDRQISVFKRSGSKAIKMIRQLTVKGFMSELEFSDYATILKKRMLDSEVKAFIHQGEKAERNEDHMSAAQYFKHAKDLLLATDIAYDEKTQDIKKISRMISGIYSSPAAKDGESTDESTSEPLEDETGQKGTE